MDRNGLRIRPARRSVWIAAVVVAVASGCSRDEAEAPSGAPPGRLLVAATFSVLGDLTSRVAGDRVDLVVLVGPASDVHTFEPVPSVGVTLAQARLVVENGMALEPWLDRLYDACGSKAVRAVASRGIKARKAEKETHAEGGSSAHDHDHEHGEFDPHFWNDPLATAVAVTNIRDALISIDPAGADSYRANAKALTEELQSLDAEVRQIVARIPQQRRKLVTTHDSLGYFADRYGFEVVGCVLDAVTTEAGDPSARHMADLVARVRASQTPVVFAEAPGNPRLMEQIAHEAKVRIVYDLYSCGLGRSGSPGDTYIGMIRSNARTITDCLVP